MILSINNLSKSFNEKKIYSGFSYNFNSNGIYTLVGDSGVGKTTLLRLIAGLDTKYYGEIIGGGAKNVSYVFQEYRLIPQLSAIDNVIYSNYNKKVRQKYRLQSRCSIRWDLAMRI